MTQDSQHARQEYQRARQRRNRQAYTERKHKAYFETHHETPLCACGCGKNVKLDQKGVPRTLAGKECVDKVRLENRDLVDIERFRATVRAIKWNGALTLTELAALFQIPLGTLTGLMYSDKEKSISHKRLCRMFAHAVGVYPSRFPKNIDPCYYVLYKLGIPWSEAQRFMKWTKA